jgi:glycosyltransferase involved in cell wall biosynthesis
VRVLHVVKTSDGARWAGQQAKILAKSGTDIHVAVPKPSGEAIGLWEKAGAAIHVVDCSLPVSNPYMFYKRAQQIKSLVTAIKPDLIHSHFVTTTIMLRLSLGRDHYIPRLFQVPGPLHMEHRLYRWAELSTAGQNDRWIASSKYIRSLYISTGISPGRVFLSYYGMEMDGLPPRSNFGLREQLGIVNSDKIVGNVNFMYPPKYYLGQVHGLKRHEDVIDAIGMVCDRRPNLVGALIGGQWGSGTSYEERLRKRARNVAGERIHFTGRVPAKDALAAWPSFDCAVHVPQSENCGGVIEPLAYEIPVIAGKVGGLPEVVLDGFTGWVVPVGNPQVLADTIEFVLDHPQEAKKRAFLGNQLVRYMFDVKRTGSEIITIYQNVLEPNSHYPKEFNSQHYVQNLFEDAGVN